MTAWVPRITPRREGPGPSPQNQPAPAPAEPNLRSSPSGVTHSTARVLRSPQLVLTPPDPVPWWAVMGIALVLQPAPIM